MICLWMNLQTALETFSAPQMRGREAAGYRMSRAKSRDMLYEAQRCQTGAEALPHLQRTSRAPPAAKNTINERRTADWVDGDDLPNLREQ